MIYICSPFAGDMKGNRQKAIDYCKYAIECGVTPIAPHLLYPQFLDDTVSSERELGMKMGLELLDNCNSLWVMGDVISKGMKEEIEYAKKNCIPIEYFSSQDISTIKAPSCSRNEHEDGKEIYFGMEVVGI